MVYEPIVLVLQNDDLCSENPKVPTSTTTVRVASNNVDLLIEGIQSEKS